MSEDVVVQRSIGAPPMRVWSMISDITRMGEWSPESTGGSWLKGAGGPAVGAKFNGTNRNGKKKWSTTGTVTEAEPGRRFAFSVDVGPIAISAWTFDIEPTDAGCTITETWTDRRGRFARWIGKPASGVADRTSHNRATMEQTLDRLASAAEAAADV
ncbi:MAG: SRPBCC family protein [Actinobacteria bacterium]|nr:SRPBCC family protein [Actinomycetota bacterium]